VARTVRDREVGGSNPLAPTIVASCRSTTAGRREGDLAMSAPDTAAEILIEGRVQGVGYRDYARRRASRLGLGGWVMNLRDGRVHVVVRGDTLTGIPARYGVSVAALVAANNLGDDSGVLRIGQRVVVPNPSNALASTPPAERVKPKDTAVREARACCRPPRCCGPRNLMLFVPDFIDVSPM